MIVQDYKGIRVIKWIDKELIDELVYLLGEAIVQVPRCYRFCSSGLNYIRVSELVDI